MQTTKTIHLNPNGNLIKMNGRIYRHFTRNLVVSLPSIFYAINHGATVHEVMSNGETIQLTVQNYALDNEKIIREKREKEEEIRRSMSNVSENDQNDISEHNESSESIEMNTLKNDNEENLEDNTNQKKSNKRNNSKKSVED